MRGFVSVRENSDAVFVSISISISTLLRGFVSDAIRVDTESINSFRVVASLRYRVCVDAKLLPRNPTLTPNRQEKIEEKKQDEYKYLRKNGEGLSRPMARMWP